MPRCTAFERHFLYDCVSVLVSCFSLLLAWTSFFLWAFFVMVPWQLSFGLFFLLFFGSNSVVFRSAGSLVTLFHRLPLSRLLQLVCCQRVMPMSSMFPDHHGPSGYIYPHTPFYTLCKLMSFPWLWKVAGRSRIHSLACTSCSSSIRFFLVLDCWIQV